MIVQRKIDQPFFKKLAVAPNDATYPSSSPLPLSSINLKFKPSKFSKTYKNNFLQVHQAIGSGSYGTVHLVELCKDKQGETDWCVGKRAWMEEEIYDKTITNNSLAQAKERAARCQHYVDVEAHCLAKVQKRYKGTGYVPSFKGMHHDKDGRAWIVVDLIEGVKNPSLDIASDSNTITGITQQSLSIAPTMQDLLLSEHKERKKDASLQEQESHLSLIAIALGQSADTPLIETIDVIISNMLKCLVQIHDLNIVHRDIKPANILVSPNQTLCLIDFGSAADLDATAASWLQQSIGLSERAAISPIYSAPEIFIDTSQPKTALTFDCFSAALLFCQLLFQLIDERTDAGFHQQLADVNWNLDNWLQRELQGKVIPSGLIQALDVLEERSGLWSLLQAMLQGDPRCRISSKDALERWNDVKQGRFVKYNSADARYMSTAFVDGPFLQEILMSRQSCRVPDTVLRPLHFVATFRRKKPLGLVLAEFDVLNDDTANGMDNEETASINVAKWKLATADAVPGEVFVKGIVPGGQADEMGIFEIGDQLQGIGDLSFSTNGFERAVEMLQDQPRSAKYIALHFGRKSAIVQDTGILQNVLPIPALKAPIRVSDQGAWSSQGQRSSQEDAFLLHEVSDTKQRSLLLAGVMDGHLGTAASNFVLEEFPIYFVDDLISSSFSTPAELLAKAWEYTCQSYRFACQSETECIAEYDEAKGILVANKGSDSHAAGTTATLVALDYQTSNLAILNCGDSRTLIVNQDGSVVFQTFDHRLEDELDRFQKAIAQGLNYGKPFCSVSKWMVPVGEYLYAVSRSLEGPLATSRGVVSEPDISSHQIEAGMSIIMASDGLWEVIDSAEAARILNRLRNQGLNAGDAAKFLCSLAIEKGSSDNVSAVILYLE